MKKILVCTGYFYPHLGGHERYVEELFSRLPSEKFETHILTVRTDAAPDQESYRGLTIHRLDGWNILGGTFPIPKLNARFWRTVRSLRREGFALVNTQTRFFPLSFLGGMIAKRWRVRWVHTEHGTNHPRGGILVTLVGWIYDHTIGWWVIRSTNTVIVISQAAATFSRHLGARQPIVVSNGVDTDFFRPAEKKTNSMLKLVFVGRLIKAKGLQDLIAVLPGTLSNWVLDVIGSGPAEGDLRILSKDIPQIQFHGARSANDIRSYLQRADVFVNPSYAEGLPTSVLEAASCGCAIIASDVGGTAEIFPPGNAHWLLQPGDRTAWRDRLRELANNPNQRQVLGAANRRAVEQRYSWAVIATEFTRWLEHDLGDAPALSAKQS